MMRLLFPVLFFFFFLPLPAYPVSKTPLKMHVWVSYMPVWLLEDFTRETGIPVQLTFFADNRELLRKIKEEGEMLRFDIISPSAETVQELVAEGLLLPLSHDLIPNMRQLDPWFADFAYDKGFGFSVPLFWGGLGIVIDKRVVPKSVSSRILGFKDLWAAELKGKIMLPNDLRSLMSIMLLHLGHSVNDPDVSHLEAAMSALEDLAPSVRDFSNVDQLEDMGKRNIAVGVAWANEAFTRDDPGSFFEFIFPKEGSPLWIDTLAIPAITSNSEAAHAFVDFVLRPENLAKLSKASGYAVASPKAVKLLPASLSGNTVVYPPEELRSRFEPELMLPPCSLERIEKRWVNLKNRQ